MHSAACQRAFRNRSGIFGGRSPLNGSSSAEGSPPFIDWIAFRAAFSLKPFRGVSCASMIAPPSAENYIPFYHGPLSSARDVAHASDACLTDRKGREATEDFSAAKRREGSPTGGGG